MNYSLADKAVLWACAIAGLFLVVLILTERL